MCLPCPPCLEAGPGVWPLLCWSKGNGAMALERKLERHRAQPCLPAQQHSPVSSSGRSQNPAPFSALFFPRPVFLQLWPSGWPWAPWAVEGEVGSAHGAGRVLVAGRCQEFPIPLFCPGRRLGAPDSGNPNRTRMEASFFQIFLSLQMGMFIDSLNRAADSSGGILERGTCVPPSTINPSHWGHMG